MRQHTGMGVRALNPQTKEKKSQLHQELQQVRERFRGWRMAGLYVDRDDLILEFENKLKKTAAELEAKKSKGGLSPKDLKRLYWVQRRLKNIGESVKAREYTGDQLQKFCKAPLRER